MVDGRSRSLPEFAASVGGARDEGASTQPGAGSWERTGARHHPAGPPPSAWTLAPTGVSTDERAAEAPPRRAWRPCPAQEGSWRMEDCGVRLLRGRLPPRFSPSLVPSGDGPLPSRMVSIAGETGESREHQVLLRQAPICSSRAARDRGPRSTPGGRAGVRGTGMAEGRRAAVAPLSAVSIVSWGGGPPRGPPASARVIG